MFCVCSHDCERYHLERDGCVGDGLREPHLAPLLPPHGPLPRHCGHLLTTHMALGGLDSNSHDRKVGFLIGFCYHLNISHFL